MITFNSDVTHQQNILSITIHHILCCVVSIVIGYGLDDRRFEVQVPLLHIVRNRPTQPPIQWVPWALSLGVKKKGREADHSLPTSAKVKKTLIHTSTPPYTFMAWCLVKHKYKFTFLTIYFIWFDSCTLKLRNFNFWSIISYF
jgi:hypothetical protein